MLFAVLESLMTFQIHETIVSQPGNLSTGKVCPTARFENSTPVNKGLNPIYTPKIVGFRDE
jgi:hypothetical protein